MVDGIAAAVVLVEALARLGFRTSKLGGPALAQDHARLTGPSVGPSAGGLRPPSEPPLPGQGCAGKADARTTLITPRWIFADRL